MTERMGAISNDTRSRDTVASFRIMTQDEDKDEFKDELALSFTAFISALLRESRGQSTHGTPGMMQCGRVEVRGRGRGQASQASQVANRKKLLSKLRYLPYEWVQVRVRVQGRVSGRLPVLL